MTYEEIQTKIEELKLKFEPCYKLTAEDMDDVMDILNATTNQNTYSTTETLIGEYLGSSLYRKVIVLEFENVLTGNEFTVDHNLDIKQYLKTDLVHTDLDIDTIAVIPISTIHVNANSPYLNSELHVSATIINFTRNEIIFEELVVTQAPRTYHLILEYTKN